MKNNSENNLSSAESIKGVLIDYFISKLENIVIGNEVMYGSKRKVVDLLILNNNKIFGIEIKGDNDSLKRIQEQIIEYKKIFHYVIVCTTENHLKKIEELISKDIGLFLVTCNGIKEKRRPKLQRKLDKREILHTINTKYLKQIAEVNLNGLNSDEIRDYYSKKGIEKIQQILYTYLYFRIEEKYKLFLDDRDNFTHLDDIPLLSSNTTIQ